MHLNDTFSTGDMIIYSILENPVCVNGVALLLVLLLSLVKNNNHLQYGVPHWSCWTHDTKNYLISPTGLTSGRSGGFIGEKTDMISVSRMQRQSEILTLEYHG